MSPIKGLSETRRAPRLGKIRLGVKITKQREDKTEYTYPSAVDFFVCPPEILAALKLPPDGKPRELPIMFPTEDENLFAQQWYRRYSNLRGLVCKGDGETCARMVDTTTGALAERDSKEVVWREGLPCQGKACPEYQRKYCKTVMNLQFIMPSLPGLGVWQIDTGSVNSIININSAIEFIRGVYHRISFIPLTLAIVDQQVVNPDDGKKKTVHVLTLKTNGTMIELMQASARSAAVFALPAPVVDEPPEDIQEDEVPEGQKQAERHAEILWGDEPVKEKKPESPAPAKATEKEPTPEVRAAMQEKVKQAEREQIAAFNAIPSASEQKAPEPPKPPEPPDKAAERRSNAESANKRVKEPRDPATVKTANQLVNAVFTDFGLQPKEAYRILGISTINDLTIAPRDAYLTIAQEMAARAKVNNEHKPV